MLFLLLHGLFALSFDLIIAIQYIDSPILVKHYILYWNPFCGYDARNFSPGFLLCHLLHLILIQYLDRSPLDHHYCSPKLSYCDWVKIRSSNQTCPAPFSRSEMLIFVTPVGTSAINT